METQIIDLLKASLTQICCHSKTKENKRMKNELHGKLFCNIKTGRLYRYEREVVNTTNKNDGEKMVLYSKDNMYFVREKTEFFKKFIKTDFNEGTISRR